MCPVVKELEKRENIDSVVCLTGQHEEMLDQVMQIFHMDAKYNLHVMKANQTLSMITTNILLQLGEIYEQEKPELVLVLSLIHISIFLTQVQTILKPLR